MTKPTHTGRLVPLRPNIAGRLRCALGSAHFLQPWATGCIPGVSLKTSLLKRVTTQGWDRVRCSYSGGIPIASVCATSACPYISRESESTTPTPIAMAAASNAATLGCHGPQTTTVSLCRQDYAQAGGQAALDPSGFGYASAHVVFGAFDRRGYPRGLIKRAVLPFRPFRRVGHHKAGVICPCFQDHPVHDVRRRRNQVQVELALQALADDLHVQQAQEAAPEAETQRHRRFRLVGQSHLALSPAASGTPQRKCLFWPQCTAPGSPRVSSAR
jgi:hypothetical protein